MEEFNVNLLKKIYIPPTDSHKGQNGKLLVIGGSHLFHAASLWALEISSKLLDMVFYSSIPENNELVQRAKEQFRNGIVVRREDLESYLDEADCVLIGPGMNRTEREVSNFLFPVSSLGEVNKIQDEGEQTYYLTKYLLQKYPHKKWVIDAGALQMMEPEWLLSLHEMPILTPHPKEFERLFNFKFQISNFQLQIETVSKYAKDYNSIILLKGVEDIVCSPTECMLVKGGNAGMTKGGTGDVLAGLTASLYCKNEAFLSALCASYINKKAGDSLFKRVGYYFNATDLIQEIPIVMKELLIR